MANIDFSRVVTEQSMSGDRLAEAKKAGFARVVEMIDRAAVDVTGPVPVSEMLSWSAKEQAARAFVSGASSAEDEALLDGEAEITGETSTALAARIVARADINRAAVARFAGLRRNAATAIGDALTPAEVGVALDALAAALAAG